MTETHALTDCATAAATVLESFFAPGRNGIDRATLQADPFLRRVVARLEAGEPTVLPFRPPSGGAAEWVGLARTEREFRALREGLDAFVGPTWARISASRPSLDSENAVHAALAAYSGGRVLRIRGDEKGVFCGLRRMVAVWDAAPARSYREPRSPGVLRRAFESALVSGDARAAHEALSALHEGGGLDRKNGLFLEVQRLAAFGEWAELLAVPDLDDLVQAPRPAAVTDAVLQAAYHEHLAGAEAEADDGDVAEAAAAGLLAYREAVAPRFASLLDEGTPLRSVGARMVAAAGAADRGDGETLGAVHASLRADGVDSPIVEAWARAAEPDRPSPPPLPPPGGDPLAHAEAAGRLDKAAGVALALAATDADPVDRVALLLSFANVMRSQEVTRKTLGELEALDDDARARLEAVPWVARVASDLAAEDGAGGAGAPTSWGTWLERLQTDEGWSVRAAVESARRGAHEWTAQGLWEGRTVAGVADALLSVPEARVPALTEALPLLVEALQGAPDYPDPDRAPVYRAVLEHLTFEAAPTEQDVRLYAGLLPAALAGRLSSDEYARLLEGLTAALKAREASPPPDVLLDAIDATLDATCPSPEARLRLITYASGAAERFGSRWDDADFALLRSFAAEAGHAEAVPPRPVESAEAEEAHEASDPLASYAGRYVAIYTLTESAGARAAKVLAELAPGVRVETSAEHGGSPRLKEMAQRADVFVVVTRSALHAATDFIETHRKGRPLVRPLGKGTASILRALRAQAD